MTTPVDRSVVSKDGQSAERIQSLDGLRGIAAFIVLISHCLNVSQRPFANAHASEGHLPLVASLLTYTPLHVFWVGPEAVLVFFVLSGFVLSRPFIGGSRRIPVKTYYPRRLVRLYVPVLGSAVLALIMLSIPHRTFPGASTWLQESATRLHLIGVLITLVLVAGMHTNLDGIWWSLQWEVWFSILLPLMLLRNLWIYRKPLVLLGLAITVSSVGPQLVKSIPSTNVHGAIFYLPMFVIGMALAAGEQRIRSRVGSWSGPASWVSMGISVVLMTISWPITWLVAMGRLPHSSIVDAINTLLMLSGVTIIVTLSFAAPSIDHHLSGRWIQWLGSRSYSLYLIHGPTILALAFGFKMTGAPLLFVIGAATVCLLMAEVFYRLVEGPALNYLKTHLRN